LRDNLGVTTSFPKIDMKSFFYMMVTVYNTIPCKSDGNSLQHYTI